LYEVDHIFLLTDVHAPVADRLVQAGIAEGSSRKHAGQGTENRRFFFRNVMFEFLWVNNESETGSPAIARTNLLNRWQNRMGTACPYGICFRPMHASSPPFTLFPSWSYTPPYLPDNMAIQVADNASVLPEPFLFYLASAQAPDGTLGPINHPAGMEMLTDIQLTLSGAPQRTPSLEAVSTYMTLETGENDAMTLVFDNGKQGQVLDLRPDAPLIFHY
jgi:hypothetical protein